MKKRFMSILLILCMILTLLPTTAMAAAAAPTTQPTAKVTGEDWTTFKESGLVGYKDTSGKVVIKAQFEEASPFSQGVARVKSKEKNQYGYINTMGKPITAYIYCAGETAVHDGRIGVATFGDDVVKAILKGDAVYYDEQTSYAGDKVVMKSGKVLKYDKKCGFIDTTGKQVIPCQYYAVNSFSDGLATVFKYQDRWSNQDVYKVGWIDTTGKMVIPYMSGGTTNYDWSVFDFKDGLCRYFIENDKNPDTLCPGGIINKTGKIIIPADINGWIDNEPTGIVWDGGIIAVTVTKEVNGKGVPTKGGGYVLAQHDEFMVYADDFYWSLLDSKGNIVVDKAEQDNSIGIFNYEAGYKDGYAYFGWSIYDIKTGKKISNVPVVFDSADKYMRIPSGKWTKSYIVPEPEQAGNTSWLKLSDKQPYKKYTIKLESIGAGGAAYSISYGGKYIGLTEAKDGYRLHTMDTPYLWAIEPSSTYLGHYVTIRDYSNKNLIVNASGQSTANGTNIIVWPHAGSTPDNGQIFFTNN